MTKFILGGCSRYRLGYIFVHSSFKKKDGSTRSTHIKLDRGWGTSMAVEKKMYIADQMCNMADFLADNIFVKSGGVYISSSYWNPYRNELCSISR